MIRRALVVLMVALAVPAAAQDAGGRGEAVYTAQRCALCHAVGGKGNVKGPLDGVGSRLSAEQIRQWVATPAEMTAKAKAERKPVMRAYPNLPKEELDALVVYLQGLTKG